MEKLALVQAWEEAGRLFDVASVQLWHGGDCDSRG